MRRIVMTAGMASGHCCATVQAFDPRAGLMMIPATLCSRNKRSTSGLAFGVLVGVGEDRNETEMVERFLDAGASSAKKGLLRSLMTIPTKSDEAARRLAAPR